MEHRKFSRPYFPHPNPQTNQFPTNFNLPPPPFPPSIPFLHPPPPGDYQPSCFMPHDASSLNKPEIWFYPPNSTANYYPITNHSTENLCYRETLDFPPDYPQTNLKSNENVDASMTDELFLIENKLNEWLSHHGKSSVKQKSLKEELTLPQLREELYKIQNDLSQLKKISGETSVCYEGLDEHNWLAKKSTMIDIQKRLMNQEKYLSDSVSTAVQKRIKRIQRKRAGRAARKLFQQETKTIHLEKCREMDKITDKWLQEKRKQETDEKNERLKNRRAKLILADVKRRSSEVKQTLEVIQSLAQLKNLRKSQAANQKGFLIPTVFDEEFDQEIDSLTRLLTSQQNRLDEEEATLKKNLEAVDNARKNKSISDHLEEMLFGFPLNANSFIVKDGMQFANPFIVLSFEFCLFNNCYS